MDELVAELKELQNKFQILESRQDPAVEELRKSLAALSLKEKPSTDWQTTIGSAPTDQAGKFLRTHSQITPITSKLSEKEVIDWLEDLTNKMTVIRLNDSDKRIVLQSLVLADTLKRDLAKCYVDNLPFAQSVENWLKVVFPRSWYNFDLFDSMVKKQAYKSINDLVAEVAQNQRRWTDHYVRQGKPFNTPVEFWKMILVRTLPPRLHGKVQDVMNSEHETFEEFCTEIAQKLEILEAGGLSVWSAETQICTAEQEEQESDLDLWPAMRGTGSGRRQQRSSPYAVATIPRRTEVSKSTAESPPTEWKPPEQNDIRPPPTSRRTSRCSRCGKPGHHESDCWLFRTDLKCRKCGHRNHLEAQCRNHKEGLSFTVGPGRSSRASELEDQIKELQAELQRCRDAGTKASN
jgi:DNA-binding MarR family transcriptional regulator